MRRETTDFLLRLYDPQVRKLNDLAERSGNNRTALMRAMIMDYQLCEKPDPEFYRVMGEMSRFGNNLNQLVAKAHSLNFIDVPMLIHETEEWGEFRLAVSERFLKPKRMSHGSV